MDHLNKLSERLAELRKNKGLTLKDLSEELGDIKPVTLSRYENKRREPNICTLLKLADYFNCSVDYLLGKVEYMNLEELVELNNIDLERASDIIDLYNAIVFLKGAKLEKKNSKTPWISYKNSGISKEILWATNERRQNMKA